MAFLAPVAAEGLAGGAAAEGGAAAGGGLMGGGGFSSMLRGFSLGNLFGHRGGGEKAPKPSSADQIQAVSANLNPAQFGSY